MRYFILVTIITLSSILGSTSGLTFQGDCPSIEATVVTKKPDPGFDNGEITINAKGGKGQLRYIFMNSKGRPINSNNEKQNFVKNLSTGFYKCAVVDEAGCIKLLKIELN